MFGLAIAAGAAGALVSAGYQSMAPTGQWYGRTFTGLCHRSKKLALTFDDGPNGEYTLKILEVLAKHNVLATFFMIGAYVRKQPEIALAVAKAGHVLGNHSYTHPNLIFTSRAKTKSELEICEQALGEVAGKHSRLFRPPFGGRRPASLHVARQLGLIPIMWNITAWDWKASSAEYIEAKINRQIRGGDVILLHDGGHQRIGIDRSLTVVATDRTISRCKAEGFEFVTVLELMAEAESSASPQRMCS
jgi:peptidoglycan/xylan/chitin deacetylase (PgdA/CDA1 family)